MNSPTSRKLCAIALPVLLLSLLLGVTSCGREMEKASSTPAQQTETHPSQTKVSTQEAQDAAATYALRKDSLADTEKLAETAAVPLDRKIVRNAELAMNVPPTAETQQKIASITEAHGGFVVTAEAKQRESPEPSQRTLDIKLVVRIPESQFGPVLDQI